MPRHQLEDERGACPDDDDRIARRVRRDEGGGIDADRRGEARRRYLRWLLESAAATPRLM